jgi:hypothetical protein
MTNPGSKSEFDRLKAELQRLKRAQAPWYFESSLHQRLHGGRRPRVRHAPFRFGSAITISFFSLAVIALAVYVVFLNSTLFHPGVPRQDARSALPDSASARQSGGAPVQESSTTHAPPAVRMDRSEEAVKVLPKQTRTPDAESARAASDTVVKAEQPAPSPEENRKVSPVDTTAEGTITERGDQTPKGRPDSSATSKPPRRVVPDTTVTRPHTP